jgi:hypothetical protein
MDYSRQENCLNAQVFDQMRFRHVCGFPDHIKQKLIWTPPHISQGSIYGVNVSEAIKRNMASAGGFNTLADRYVMLVDILMGLWS